MVSRPTIHCFNLSDGTDSTNRGQLSFHHEFPEAVAGWGSFLNDFVVSPLADYIYITDTSMVGMQPGLVVLDVGSNHSWRALEDDPALVAETLTAHTEDPQHGRRSLSLMGGLFSIRPNVDSIAMDAGGEWIYFKPVVGTSLYRMKSMALRQSETEKPDAAGIQVFAQNTTISDGILYDDAHSAVLLTDFEHFSITRVKANGQMDTLVTNESLLRWPDGLAIHNGYLWISAACWFEFSEEQMAAEGPFHLLKVPLE
jgi:sugar lactone lactonase YvrE